MPCAENFASQTSLLLSVAVQVVVSTFNSPEGEVSLTTLDGLLNLERNLGSHAVGYSNSGTTRK